MSKKRTNLADFGGQTFAKFRIPNFAKSILQALISISRNSRNFCNTIQKLMIFTINHYLCFDYLNICPNVLLNKDRFFSCRKTTDLEF